jgi:hypothetical protein
MSMALAKCQLLSNITLHVAGQPLDDQQKQQRCYYPNNRL